MKSISLFVICTLMLSCAATKDSGNSTVSNSPIIIKAMDKKVKTNLLKANYGWGKEVPVLATSPKSKAASKWFVEFPVVVDEPGNYELGISLAGKKNIPFDVIVNDNNVLSSEGFKNGKIGGLNASEFTVGNVSLTEGENIIKIKNDTSGGVPHITQFSITKTSE